MIHSYPTVFNIGHRAIQDIFKDEVIVEEKVDGSQFSFGLIPDENMLDLCNLECRSKGKNLILDAPEKMFIRAVETAQSLSDKMRVGWIYRCEYLEKPHHNVIAYDRAPNRNLILFDVMTGEEEYLPYAEKKIEAERLGLECVPLLYQGKINDFSEIMKLLETESVLGGAKIEGLVFKNYQLFTVEKKVAIGKYVSEKFKEKHDADWKANSLGVVDKIIAQYRTEARFSKAVQHLRERGEITDSPKDIGALLIEAWEDTVKECKDEIMESLWRETRDKIRRGVLAGLPEWYKEQLGKMAFSSNAENAKESEKWTK